LSGPNSSVQFSHELVVQHYVHTHVPRLAHTSSVSHRNRTGALTTEAGRRVPDTTLKAIAPCLKRYLDTSY
jgi:hypothetical protein